ncbi:MAG: cytochrome c [Bdellovibrionales bacterium]|nr:cytochrome c [Bdellovibrionales bacterium]
MQNDSYNRGGFIAFLFSMVFSLTFFIYISMIHPGIDLKEVKEQAPGAEQTVAGGGGAVDVSKIAKPWEDNPDMVAHGKQVYGNVCAVCHGPAGMGDGPAGKGLTPPPRNFVEGKWKHGGDSIALFETIKNGMPGTSMAAFGTLPLNDRWALVQFIHSVTKNRIKDDAAKLEAFAKTAK